MRLAMLLLLLATHVLFSMEQGLRRRKPHIKKEINKCLMQHSGVIFHCGTYFAVTGSFCLGAYCSALEAIKEQEITHQMCYCPEIKEACLQNAKVSSFMAIAGFLCCLKGIKDLCG